MEAATLNNRGSHHRQAIDNRWLFLFLQSFNVDATLKIEIFEFFSKDATKNLLFGLFHPPYPNNDLGFQSLGEFYSNTL